MDFSPISSYGFIGNLGTCALVGMNGSVDWCCMPFLDSPSVFAAILDPKKGGRFAVRPADEVREVKQEYIPETNVLRTVFTTEGGRLELTDWFHMGTFAHEEEEHHRLPALFRQVRCIEGNARAEMRFDPRPDYARGKTVLEEKNGMVFAHCGDACVELRTDCPFQRSKTGMTALVALDAGSTCAFVCTDVSLRACKLPDAGESLRQTIEYWRTWVRDCQAGECPFMGRWHDDAVRSSLVLKILAGGNGIAAAATTSLPEVIGGSDNWDYRFSWVRDASFTIQALAAMGHFQDAREYLDWLCTALCGRMIRPADMRALYPLHGSLRTEEEELSHLRGYRDSRPVRIGNAAEKQRQLDIYGEVLDSVYRSERLHPGSGTALSGALSEIVQHVCDVWKEPDSGIWESRGRERHYTYSKVMCWVALDRGIRLAEEHGWEDADIPRWRAERDAIREAVMRRGYSEKRRCFAQELDGGKIDATALLFPALGFVPPDHPAAMQSLETVRRELASGALVYRSEEHHGKEGAFGLCSFWLVDALTIAGNPGEAKEIFEELLRHANHVGLYAEEIDPKTGEFLGNFPQAFTHVGLINAAARLGQALEARRVA